MITTVLNSSRTQVLFLRVVRYFCDLNAVTLADEDLHQHRCWCCWWCLTYLRPKKIGIKNSLRYSQRAHTDLLWSNVTLPTRGPNWPFRCWDFGTSLNHKCALPYTIKGFFGTDDGPSMAEVTWDSYVGKPEMWAAFSKKEYVVYLGIDRLWVGCKLSPECFGANFPSVKILDFRGAKVFARFVAKRVPKCWEPRKMRLQLGEMVQIFSTALFSHSWDCSARLVYQSSAKGWKILSTRKLQTHFLPSSAHLDNTNKEIFSILKNDF